MLEYRVTKYDPAYRDARGAFTRDEWTSSSDIGRSFAGVVLTEAEYRRVEDAYAAVAVGFLRDAGVVGLVVTDVERRGDRPVPFAAGAVLGLAEIDTAVRHLLRDEFWCRLEGEDAFIHVGWDYYMFVGVPRLCPGAEEAARRLGLFVEPFESPYATRKES